LINLQTLLDVGTRLIEEGKLNGKDTRILEETAKKIETNLYDELRNIKLDEFSKRNTSIEVYSDVLETNVWFCSDKEMVDQVQNDDPTAVCYTAEELQNLIGLNPNVDLLKKIHDTKTVFNPSKLIE